MPSTLAYAWRVPEATSSGDTTFVDDGRTLLDFTTEVLVACPRCGKRAFVTPVPYGDDESALAPHWIEPRRLVCPACGLVRSYTDRHAAYGGAVDPFFQLPLWLQTRCRGQVLWAFNAAHVDHLQRFVSASQRVRALGEGRAMSLVERLPSWITAAGNRDDVSRALRQLAGRALRGDRAGDRGTG